MIDRRAISPASVLRFALPICLLLLVAGCGRPLSVRSLSGPAPWQIDQNARRIAELERTRGTVNVSPSRSQRRTMVSNELKSLVEHGLEDPVTQIREDLASRPELIPFESKLGGTMGFYHPEDIVILSRRWVLARFEDGHVTGQIVLAYEVLPGGEIQWRVLDAMMD